MTSNGTLLLMMSAYGPWVAALGLVFARMLPVVLMAPFLGGGLPSISLKFGLALVLALVIAPLPGSPLSMPADELIAPLLVWQVAIGLLVGVISRLPFQAQEMAGELIEFVTGLRNDEVFAPQLGARMTILGTLQSQVALITFFALNGHLIVIGALATSVHEIPVTQLPGLTAGAASVCATIVSITGMAIATAFNLAAPVLVALLIAQLAVGAVSKALRAPSLYEDAPPLKALLACAAALASAGIMMSNGSRFALQIAGSLETLVQQVK